MTRLINLLSWLPGHSGFGSYVQRVVPQLDGLRLQLGADGHGQLVPASSMDNGLAALGAGAVHAVSAALQPGAARPGPAGPAAAPRAGR